MGAQKIERGTMDFVGGIELAAKSVRVDDKTGDVLFDAVAVDKQRLPNRRGFIFDWDSPDDVVIKNWLANPVLLHMHDDFKIPVGWVESVQVTTRVVQVACRIVNLADDPELAEYDRQHVAPVRGAVRKGLLKAVSIGFYILRAEDVSDEERPKAAGALGPIRRVKQFEIVELSVVTIGAHETALIKQERADAQAVAAAQSVIDGFFRRGRLVPSVADAQADGQMLYRLSLDGGVAGSAVELQEAVLVGDGLGKLEGETVPVTEVREEPAESGEEQPYPNEHACRLVDPKTCKDPWARVTRKHDGKDYDVIRGTLKSTGKMVDQAFRYPKKTWKASSARSHCEEHDGTFEPASEGASAHAEDMERLAGSWRAIPYSRHGDGPKAAEDAPWDAAAEVAAAEVDGLKVMCVLEDGDALDAKGGYKGPHHTAKGHKAVWRGCAALMGVILGARGGFKGVGAEAVKGAYNHVAKHYKQFDKEAPELTLYADDVLKELHARGVIVVPGMADAGATPREDSIEELARTVREIEEKLATLAGEDARLDSTDQATPGPERDGATPPAAARPQAAGPQPLTAADLDLVRAVVRGVLMTDPALQRRREDEAKRAVEQIRRENMSKWRKRTK